MGSYSLMYEASYVRVLHALNCFYFQVTPDQVKYLKQSTIGQASNKSWFQQRARRITASNFKAATVAQPNPGPPGPRLGRQHLKTVEHRTFVV